MIILATGGIDSAFLAYDATISPARYVPFLEGDPLKKSRERVTLLYVDFGGARAKREKEALHRVHETLCNRGLSIKPEIEIVAVEGAQLDDVAPSTENVVVSFSDVYIPAKTKLMLDAAVDYGLSVDDPLVLTGHSFSMVEMIDPDVLDEEDTDSGPSFIALYNEMLRMSFFLSKPDKKPYVLAPLSTMNKPQVVEMAHELGIPLQQTWSCLYGGEKPCGVCAQCLSVRNACEFVLGEDHPFTKSLCG